MGEEIETICEKCSNFSYWRGGWVVCKLSGKKEYKQDCPDHKDS